MSAAPALDFEKLVVQSSSAAEAKELCLQAILDSYEANCQSAQTGQFGQAEQTLKRIQELRKQHGKQYRLIVTYTSNMISCGMREVFAFLAKEKLVDAFITTAGGIEEDVIKCFGPTLLGDFSLPGKALRNEGMNRIGNLLVPNDNYVAFEDFFDPLLAAVHERQRQTQGEEMATPSEILREMGLRIGPFLRDNEQRSLNGDEKAHKLKAEGLDSCLSHWCALHDIPVFCPAMTDGSMGDMTFFYSFKNPGLLMDTQRDSERMVDWLEEAKCGVGVISLGGGLPRHHVLRACELLQASVKQQELVVISTDPEAVSFSKEAASQRCERRQQGFGSVPHRIIPPHAVTLAVDATLVFAQLVARNFCQ